MARFLHVAVLAGSWTAFQAAPALAQFSPERIFDYYDRDRDGELDDDEMERVRGPLRETLERSGGRSVDRDEFMRLYEEQGRRDGEGRDGNSRSSSSTNTRSAPKPRERVTVDLPSKYTEGDRDRDGQLGLYEWIQWKSRAAIGEFVALDRNRDGFLTPRELTIAEKANGDGGSPANGSSTRSSAGAATTASRSTSPSGTTPSGAPRQLDEATAGVAREAFQNLDKDRDGRLSEEEWRNSQAARARFEDAEVRLPTPADLDTFLRLYPVEERTQEVSRDGSESRSSSTSGGGEERPSRRVYFGRGR